MWRYILCLFSLIMSLSMSNQAWALACFSTDSGGKFGVSGGKTDFYIDSAVVPNSVIDNQVVWRGPSQRLQITCYKDATNYLEMLHSDEQVYFWPGNTLYPNIPTIQGIKVGFRYNGVDYFNTKVPLEGMIVKGCKPFEPRYRCERRTIIKKIITYQPIIVTSTGNFTGYSQPINIFQLDGETSYNQKYLNYRSIIKNMSVITPSKCEVDVSIDNSYVDFGMLATQNVKNTVTRPFSIVVKNKTYSQDCPSVKLRGFFDNVKEAGNHDYIPLYNKNGIKISGIGIKLSSLAGDSILLNEPINPSYSVSQINHIRYNATLYATDPNNIDEGAFEGMVVYSVSYL